MNEMAKLTKPRERRGDARKPRFTSKAMPPQKKNREKHGTLSSRRRQRQMCGGERERDRQTETETERDGEREREERGERREPTLICIPRFISIRHDSFRFNHRAFL